MQAGMQMSQQSGTQQQQVAMEWPQAGIALVRLVQGESYNTLTDEMVQALDEAVEAAGAAAARVLIITGSGKTFCGGAHVKYFTDAASPLLRNPRAIRDDYVTPIIRTFAKLRDKPFVSIAAINGHALGGGCELALACDFRLMSRNARIGLTETRLGAVAGAGGVQLLAKIVGRAKALEIALCGDQWSADDAMRVGLVHDALDADGLEEGALAFAQRFLLCSPVSIAETKRALYRCETASAEEADRIALDAVAAAAAGEEWWEGMAAFAQKRAPSFRKEIE
jgi:enoyl-CoA hydratase/carnithine racemase